MDELIYSGELLDAQDSSPFLIASISSIDYEGVTLSINGGLETLQKKYSYLQTGYSLSHGDRVLVAKVSGTYVVLGKIVT
jgi:hypothetical protein